jgi:redox-sensitive bicupin YhaK (pirin superfamily)
VSDRGVDLRLIVGSMFGQTSPVATFSDTFYADAQLAAGAAIPFPADYAERAAYVIDGSVTVAGESFPAYSLLVFRPGDAITVRADTPTRILLLGGEPMDGPRHLWWNFVSSSQDRIEQAKADWKAGRFATVPGDAEFIPLPG